MGKIEIPQFCDENSLPTVRPPKPAKDGKWYCINNQPFWIEKKGGLMWWQKNLVWKSQPKVNSGLTDI